MKNRLLFFCLVWSYSLIVSCKKVGSNSGKPISLADSSLAITAINKTDLNEFDISYQLLPSNGEKYTDVYLYWSTSSDFIKDRDSALISSNTASAVTGKYNIAGLKKPTTFFTHLSTKIDNRTYYSSTRQFQVDSFKLASWFGLDTLPININRDYDRNSMVLTNFAPTARNTNTNTKVYIGEYECPVTDDEGNAIFFHIPDSVLPNQSYAIKIQKKGLTVQTTKSFYVLNGLWSTINSPDIPLGLGYNENGLMFYGTCQSAQKGYIVGGLYFHGLGTTDSTLHYENMGPFEIQVFDGQTLQWSKKYPTNPKILQEPICYYYNNSIYVLANRTVYPNTGYFISQTMMRLDLADMTWYDMDSLPYLHTFNVTSFELNGEWYIGMGARADSLDGGGTPIASKKFWKYNPATNLWTSLADFPGNVSENYPTCFSTGGKGYAFYGASLQGQASTQSDYSRQLWQYDPTTNSWTQLALPAYPNGPLPGERYSIVAYNGKAYFLTAEVREFSGYYYGFTFQDYSFEYNPVTGTFKSFSNASTAEIMKLVYSNGNNFYFQSDAFGYIDYVPNITNRLIIDH